MGNIEVLKLIKKQINEIHQELKNGSWNDDIKNNTKDKQYWEGFRDGLNSAITDYFYALIEDLTGESMEDYYEEFERLEIG